jgi:hemerythrin
MDEEHRRILAIINQMIEHPEALEGSESVSDILVQLTKYASEHFDHEERMLEEHGFPDLAAQRKEHHDFRRKIASYCLNVMNERDRQGNAPEDLLRFLKRWWNDHILSSDMKYRPYFEQRGIR